MTLIECQSSLLAQKKAKSYFLNKKQYEEKLLETQIKLLSLQQKVLRKKHKLIILLEGCDTAGKGGVVRRMAQHMDPRSLNVYSIGKPSAEESGQHYLQRFFSKLPQPGEICVFDRSWYGRVLVERVEGFAKPEEWRRAYSEINSFEKMMSDDGILVLKYLLDISYTEQGVRFKERERNPLKSWKLTTEDYRNRKKWTPNQVAFKEMKKRTSTRYCPWKVVPADSKWFSRLTILNDIVKRADQYF